MKKIIAGVLTLGSILVQISTASADIHDGLVAYWPFETTDTVTTLPDKISSALNSAAATDPRVAEALQSGQLSGGGDLSDTSFIQKLPDFLALPFKNGFSESIDLVFLVAAGVVAIADHGRSGLRAPFPKDNCVD